MCQILEKKLKINFAEIFGGVVELVLVLSFSFRFPPTVLAASRAKKKFLEILQFSEIMTGRGW